MSLTYLSFNFLNILFLLASDDEEDDEEDKPVLDDPPVQARTSHKRHAPSSDPSSEGEEEDAPHRSLVSPIYPHRSFLSDSSF